MSDLNSPLKVYLNVEIKARCENPDNIRAFLKSRNAEFKGIDEQTDTYFNVSNGRLKLREGNIENNLIYYQRDDQSGAKSSHFSLVKISDPASLKEVLGKSNGILVTVKKKREIYYIENVKFHIDQVPGLGSFIEIEAGNIIADIKLAELKAQCDYYLNAFGIKEEQLIKNSYSDMLIEQDK